MKHFLLGLAALATRSSIFSNAQDALPIVSVAFDLTAIQEALVPPFAEFFLPVLIEYINEEVVDGLEAEAQVGDCCNRTDFGARLTASISNFAAGAINNDQVSVTVQEHDENPENRFFLRLAASNLQIDADFRSSLAVAAGIPFVCRVGANFELTISEIGLVVDVGVQEDGTTFDVQVTEIFQSELALDLDPIFELNGCSIVAGLVVQVFDIVQDELLEGFADRFATILLDFVENQFSSELAVSFEIPELAPIEIVPGGNLTISPEVQEIQVDFDQNSLGGTAGASFLAELTLPEWRAGRSLEKEFDGEESVPAATSDFQGNINVGVAGINAVIESIWYLVWSDIATEEEDEDSSFCKDTAISTDPCPYPPIVESNMKGRPDFLVTRLIFFFRGLFTSFTYKVQITPPSLQVREEDLRGSVPLSVEIIGTRWLSGKVQTLARVSAEAEIAISIPDFDAEAGTFSNLRLVDFDIEDADLSFTGLYFFLPGFIIRGITVPLIESIVRVFTNRINTEIENALSELPPIKIPDIEDFLLEGLTFRIALIESVIRGVPATRSEPSFLFIGGSLISSFVSTEELDQRTERDEIGAVNEPFITAISWATEATNPEALFFSIFSPRNNDIVESHIIRVNGGALEELDGNDSWVSVVP